MLYDITIHLDLPKSDADSERKRSDEVSRIERKIRLDAYYKGVYSHGSRFYSYTVSYKKISKQGLMQITSEFSELESIISIMLEKAK